MLDGGKENWFIDMAWSPDGQILAASDFFWSKVYFWNRAGEALTNFWAGQEETGQLAWSPDGKYLASCGGDEQTRLWNWQGQQVGSLRDAGGKTVCNLAWSPDSQVIASNLEGAPRLWSTDGWEIVTFNSPAPLEVTTYLRWSPDGKTLAVGYLDGTIHLWK